MWIVRIIIAVVMFAMVAAFGTVLKRRTENDRLLENRPVNLLGVIIYNLACYAMAGLPSDPSVFPPPAFLAHTGVRTGFLIAGATAIALGAVFFIVAVRQRKTVGGENVKEGLLTGGVYRIARHPIYTGIVMVSLGLALTVGTWDGLLMVPVIWLVNAMEASIEEIFDIGARYPSEYAEYRKQTGMFGPASLWAGLIVFLAGLAVAGSI